MKKFFMTLALALGILSVDAQTKDYVDYERGYRADITVSTSISEQYTISTSHGFSFGNGLYVGGVFNTEYKMNRMLINPMVGINVRHFTVGLGYELQHAFKGVIENKASMNNVHLRVGYTF